MGKFTAIADVGQALVQVLREHLCPEVLLSPEHIGLCSPVDRGDVLLGLHLYDIRQSQELRAVEMVSVGADRQRYPSSYLTLGYMITAYSKADVKHRATEDQRVLGKVIQTFEDTAVLGADSYAPVLKAGGMDIRIQMQALEIEMQQRIWNVPNEAYRTSLFYRVGPVEIESERERSIQRIVDLDLAIKEK